MARQRQPKLETRIVPAGAAWALETRAPGGEWERRALGSYGDMRRLERAYRQPRKLIFRADEDLAEAIRARAAREGISMQALFERAMRAYLNGSGSGPGAIPGREERGG